MSSHPVKRSNNLVYYYQRKMFFVVSSKFLGEIFSDTSGFVFYNFTLTIIFCFEYLLWPNIFSLEEEKLIFAYYFQLKISFLCLQFYAFILFYWIVNFFNIFPFLGSTTLFVFRRKENIYVNLCYFIFNGFSRSTEKRDASSSSSFLFTSTYSSACSGFNLSTNSTLWT